MRSLKSLSIGIGRDRRLCNPVAGVLLGIQLTEDFVEAKRPNRHLHQSSFKQDLASDHLSADRIHTLNLYEILSRIHHTVRHPTGDSVHFRAHPSDLVADRPLSEEAGTR